MDSASKQAKAAGTNCMSRVRNQHSLGISLFPCLAVLICTMGALIVLLIVVARVSRLQAAQTAATSALDVQADKELLQVAHFAIARVAAKDGRSTGRRTPAAERSGRSLAAASRAVHAAQGHGRRAGAQRRPERRSSGKRPPPNWPACRRQSLSRNRTWKECDATRKAGLSRLRSFRTSVPTKLAAVRSMSNVLAMRLCCSPRGFG